MGSLSVYAELYARQNRDGEPYSENINSHGNGSDWYSRLTIDTSGSVFAPVSTLGVSIVCA